MITEDQVTFHRRFRIVPKRDFPKSGYFIEGKYVKEGWVVLDPYGCNMMPGAIWFRFIDSAKIGIDVYLETRGGEEFHERLGQELKKKRENG